RFGSRPGMTDATVRREGLWAPLFLGVYAALLALAPTPAWLLFGTLPALLLWLAWWVLAGAPDRWLPIFLCAAVLLPPLPIALGNSGPHPSLAIAALGLMAGAIYLREWRVPSGALSRAILILFFVLLASSALAAYYSGVPVALQTLARVLL